ncbi:4-hydroxymandelate oxidase [Rhodoferax ferrireducens]|uniref:4-hydroxymandelate oxidase n=1 Tax=Rhodoferax ferrireducens TaxID=192843 RepID=A0ABU2C2G9_9BURK|nr:4-hydroxymandelate oxidase [Rhodoferax ferrireducens]
MISPVVAQIPPGVVTLEDHASHAHTVLDANAWAYFSGGAGDEITLRANRCAWDAQLLQPRVLQALAGGHTRTTLLGRTLAHPILLAPVAYQRMAHPDGELASAYAAAALGAGMVLSTQSSIALETIAAAVIPESARGLLCFQLYLQHDRGFSLDLVRRAEQAGYDALVLTVDAPTNGARDRERRANFRLPPGVSAVNLAGLAAAPAPALQPGQSALFDGLLAHAPTWDDVAWLQAHTRLPILLKGILHPDDARQAAALGLAGVIVSNHGGRTLDTTPATAAVLPRIKQAVGDMPVLVDGGIRRGTDVLKAMALGASAVLVGRPYVYGLANAGAVGVAHVLRLLRDELEIAMALCGCATLAQAGPALLFAQNPGNSTIGIANATDSYL